MPKLKVLVACEFSGVVREAFRKLGHNAWSCDILPSEIPGNHFQQDVTEVGYAGFDLLIAHPPCLRLTARGRYRSSKEEQRAGEEFFMKMMCAPIERICVENPKGVMSNLYRKPDQIIHPWQFGHKINKATCLWLQNLPLLQATEDVGPEEPVHIDSTTGKKRYYLDYLPGNSDRSKIRSRTFQGIANAMAEQWGGNAKA